MFFVSEEVQETANGVRTVLPLVYDDYNAALANYYTVLAAAAVSTTPYHAAFIYRDDGLLTDVRVFDRRAEV